MNPAPFRAYRETPDCRILCSSPERFLRVRGERAEIRLIIETRPRSHSAEDRMLAESLRQSTKDRAESLMITDLLYNDLGKVCAIGSVPVPTLFQVLPVDETAFLLTS
ncbi:chorismate-binding protein [Thiocapsa bogorovii]|nr:chorismate-binding protein [Thiocapsa bogorovii]